MTATPQIPPRTSRIAHPAREAQPMPPEPVLRAVTPCDDGRGGLRPGPCPTDPGGAHAAQGR